MTLRRIPNVPAGYAKLYIGGVEAPGVTDVTWSPIGEAGDADIEIPPMGSTSLEFTCDIRVERTSWRAFRRALRQPNQRAARRRARVFRSKVLGSHLRWMGEAQYGPTYMPHVARFGVEP